MQTSLRVMRERMRDAEDALDAVSDHGSQFGSAAILGITTTVTTYPTTPNVFYAVNPQYLTGNDVESATPTFVTDTSTVIYALNIGSTIPPNGTEIVASAVGGRWVFRYDY